MLKWLFKLLLCEYAICYWAGAATVAASAISSSMSKSATNSANGTSKKANAQNRADIQAQQATNTSNYQPYRDSGTGANKLLDLYLGIGNGNGTNGTAGFTPLSYDKWAAQHPAVTTSGALDPRYVADFGFASAAQRGANSGTTTGGPTQAGYQQYLASHPSMSGTSATNNTDPRYGSLLKSFSPDDLANDTVYNSGLQFGLDNGNQAINRLAAANGGIDSGATLKALTRFGNDYGTTKAAGAYDRFNTDKNSTYNMLSGQQGVGLNATNSLSGQNSGLLGSTVNSNTNTANQVSSNILNNGANQNNAIQSGIGNYLYNQRVNNGSVVGAAPYNNTQQSSVGGWWA